eukprot:Gb_16237 [translate_table: standard]
MMKIATKSLLGFSPAKVIGSKILLFSSGRGGDWLISLPRSPAGSAGAFPLSAWGQQCLKSFSLGGDLGLGSTASLWPGYGHLHFVLGLCTLLAWGAPNLSKVSVFPPFRVELRRIHLRSSRYQAVITWQYGGNGIDRSVCEGAEFGLVLVLFVFMIGI